MNVTTLEKKLTVLEQAKAEVAKEQTEKAKKLMVSKLREIAAAEAVLKGLNMQLEDLQAQVDAGTL